MAAVVRMISAVAMAAARHASMAISGRALVRRPECAKNKHNGMDRLCVTWQTAFSCGLGARNLRVSGDSRTSCFEQAVTRAGPGVQRRRRLYHSTSYSMLDYPQFN